MSGARHARRPACRQPTPDPLDMAENEAEEEDVDEEIRS